MIGLRGALAGLLALSACSERATPVAPATSEAATPAAAVEPAPVAPPTPPPKPVRRVSVKEASGVAEEVQAGARLPLPHAFVLTEKGLLTLDFEHGARVRVSGPARALADLSPQDLLLCGAGSVSVDLAPSAPTPQSGFVLLTPGGMLTLVRGGRYALRVEANGTTQGFLVSGSATLRAAAAPADQEGWLLGPGESFVLTPQGGLERRKHTLATLAQAEAATQALRPPRARKAGADMPALDALLAGVSTEVEELKARQQKLSDEHRALARARDGGVERLAELQRELAQQAERLARARARLRLVLGQRAAAAQTAALGGEDADSTRARALLSP